MDHNYIKQFIGNFRVVNTLTDQSLVPQSWHSILESSNQRERVQKVCDIWSQSYNQKLSTLIKTFDRYLLDVHIIEAEEVLAMLYIFDQGGEEQYYIGKNPLQKKIPAAVLPLWNKLPDDFTRFYQQVHNGWYELNSEAVGPLSVEDFTILSSNEWGILDEIKPSFSLDKVVSVFSNGAGGYLCWNLNGESPEALLWWHDEAPDTNIDFWDVLDEWATMGIDEE